MTNSQLQKLCKKWQKRLRLEDWDVLARLDHMIDMPHPMSYGTCMTYEDSKQAIITILQPAERGHFMMGVPSIEETLVHELLHIHFGLVERKGRGKEVDQVINALVPALLGAEKGVR